MENLFDKLIKGIEFQMEKVVKPEDSASIYGSGLVEVFSTPAMIAFMEGTCYRSVMTFLPKGFSTVGFEVNIRHIKPTPIGMTVKCNAVLSKVEDKRLQFSVEAYDEEGKIGEGTHIRYIIDEKKFYEKLQKKK